MNTEQLKEKIFWLTDRIGLVDFYLEEIKKLEKRDSKFIICDIDDTLLCRERLAIEEPLLKENRGQAGNDVVINHFGIHNIIDRFYANQNAPQDIIDLMKENEDNLILTAWIPEYAQMKARAWNFDSFPIRVVYAGEDKILETIRYILFDLKYIPSEIIVYEDRPEYFVEYRDFLEEILWTRLTIMYVEMNGNNGYKKIEAI